MYVGTININYNLRALRAPKCLVERNAIKGCVPSLNFCSFGSEHRRGCFFFFFSLQGTCIFDKKKVQFNVILN